MNSGWEMVNHHPSRIPSCPVSPLEPKPTKHSPCLDVANRVTMHPPTDFRIAEPVFPKLGANSSVHLASDPIDHALL